ncbi:glycosyltransferase 87 family protein [Nocardia bhagyanarayanae]|uniref:Alpha-1,2-mannosyltransferase n=1 Tax=Nocardia bhagyanarayanae TaxID=1215925 RepID=A0A543F849_9NOCA|nr:glycosyltransferase 87 family protein [Nocardia bhagyanarayanae]TQM29996.1 alpha-1,2-mannosyltransferase [Nocardia bhagyanarayanae]
MRFGNEWLRLGRYFPSRRTERTPSAPPLEFPRSNATLLLLLACAITAVTLLFTTVDPWLDKAGILVGGLDVHVYRDGAWRILHDQPLYSEPTLRGLLYTYTPFSAIVFLPTNLIPWEFLSPTWLTLNLGVLFGCVMMSWRLLGYRWNARLATASALIALTCAFIEPVRTTLFYGQINLILMLLVLWVFSRDEHAKLRGLGVGIAAGIKLVPLYFIVQLLALRQWRSAATAALAFLGSVVLTWLVLPADSRQYWTSTFFQSERIAPDTHPANQSLRGVLAHLLHGPAPLWLWLLLALPVLAAGLVLATALHRHGERLLSVTLAGLTSCVVSPFSWGHHWVWFVPLLVYLVHRAQSNPRWWFAAAVLYVSIGGWTYHWSETWVSVGVFLLPPSWPIAPVLMNMYVIAYLVALGAIAVLVRRRDQSSCVHVTVSDRKDPELDCVSVRC